RETPAHLAETIQQLLHDADPQVRRELAIALHHNPSAEAPAAWASLAMQYDGQDRWYLEALGIGADRQWERFFKAWLNQVKDPLRDAASSDIVWRARTDLALPWLAQLAADKNVPLQNRLRYFRAFDFHPGNAKSAYLLRMIGDSNDIAFDKVVLRALDRNAVKQSPAARKALAKILRAINSTPEYLEFVKQYEVKSESKNLLQLAIDSSGKDLGRDAAALLLTMKGDQLAWARINSKDTAAAIGLLSSLSRVGSKESIDMVQRVALSSKYPDHVREEAAAGIGKSWGGEERVLAILKARQVPQPLIPFVVAGVKGAWRSSVRNEAESYLPGHVGTVAKAAPTLQELNALPADAEKGKLVFQGTCSICHMVGVEGKDFGPKLSEIGSKYAKDGLLNAIVHPSDGISFGFEGWELKLKDGSVLKAIIASKTETDIDLKFPGGSRQQIKTGTVASMKEMKESMMPADLYQSLSNRDLANLLAYLSGLKKK
ncbi:MAG TPA: c-type cytochrome, partial [Puia sp.]|nr:c-type cytochrome [Puia sp.]